jgi:ribosomal protein L24
MRTLRSKFDIVLERLNKEGKVTEINEASKGQIIEKVTKELEDYRFNNQKKIRESQEEIATIVLTAYYTLQSNRSRRIRTSSGSI